MRYSRRGGGGGSLTPVASALQRDIGWTLKVSNNRIKTFFFWKLNLYFIGIWTVIIIYLPSCFSCALTSFFADKKGIFYLLFVSIEGDRSPLLWGHSMLMTWCKQQHVWIVHFWVSCQISNSKLYDVLQISDQVVPSKVSWYTNKQVVSSIIKVYVEYIIEI